MPIFQGVSSYYISPYFAERASTEHNRKVVWSRCERSIVTAVSVIRSINCYRIIRFACYRIIHSECNQEVYSHSIVATGFSEISQRTRFTPGTSAMILSLIVQRTLNGISGTDAVTASTVLTARMITAHPM